MSKCVCGKLYYGADRPCHYQCSYCEKPAPEEEYDFIKESGMCRSCFIGDAHHDDEKLKSIVNIFAEGTMYTNFIIMFDRKLYDINELGKMMLEALEGNP